MPINPLPAPPSRSDPNNFSTRGDAFLGALPAFAEEANALAVAMNLNSTTDASTSSVLIGTGAKTFVVTAGKSFQPGMYLVFADAAAPSTNSMFGQVTSYGGSALVMNIIGVRGSGTKASWVISQSAPGGAAAGANSDITSLSALTTPLSVAQGGTGGVTPLAARDGLGVVQGAGQCRLIKSGSNVVLMPYSGNCLPVNGGVVHIPSAGVALAPTGLTSGVLYYVYAYLNGGVLALEASATSHLTDATTGVEVKSGDATRTLIGMVRPIAGPAFADTATQRLVLSWFNQRPLVGTNAFTSSQLSGLLNTYFEINGAFRVEFLCWANTLVDSRADGSVVSTAAGGSACTTVLSYDGAIGDAANFCSASAANVDYPVSVTAPTTSLSEGNHYSTLFGNLGGNGWRWMGGASPGQRCSIKTITWG